MAKRRVETTSVHGPHEAEKKNAPVATPIYQSATFQVEDMAAQVRLEGSDNYYTRHGNPTHAVAEEIIAALEGAEQALVFSSGMAAITTALLSALKAGDHVVAQRELYGGASAFLHHWLPRFGVEVTLVSADRPEEFEAAIRRDTRLVYLESPTNPTLRVVDLKRVAEAARRRGVLTMIDSTFATPVNSRPIEHGIDVVIHSGTKYLGGHADILCGAVAGPASFLKLVRAGRVELGGAMDPHASWLLIRGLKTLPLRVERQNQNALRLAEWLEQQTRVRRVHYPFLKSHPQHELARRQMSGGGGVLGFELDGAHEDARRLVESLRLFTLAPSLGGVESLVTIPALTSHIHLSPEERQRTGITDTLIRLAVGVEAVEDLIADLEQALASVSPAVSQVAR